MKKKYQNGFFLFGIVVLVIMVTQLDFAEVWRGLQHAGYWFFAVVVLWAFLYIFNQRLRVCPELCHTGWIDGWRALSHYGIVAPYWRRTCHIVGALVRYDAHFQSFLVLVAFHSALHSYAARQCFYGYYALCGLCFLPDSYLVLLLRV